MYMGGVGSVDVVVAGGGCVVGVIVDDVDGDSRLVDAVVFVGMCVIVVVGVGDNGVAIAT